MAAAEPAAPRGRPSRCDRRALGAAEGDAPTTAEALAKSAARATNAEERAAIRGGAGGRGRAADGDAVAGTPRGRRRA